MSNMRRLIGLMKKTSPAVYTAYNPADKGTGVSLSSGNLNILNASGANEAARSLISKSSGKWYWEITVSVVRQDLGVANSSESIMSFSGASSNSCGYNSSGVIFIGGAVQQTVATYTGGDIIGIALDATGRTVTFYKNNVLQGVAQTISGIPGALFAMSGGSGSSGSSSLTNFGATALTYSPPSGYAAGLYT